MIIIFGASGDLTRRKLVPALYELCRNGHLPERFAVLGIGRTPYDDDSFRKYIQEAFGGKNGEFSNKGDFLGMLHYHAMDPSKEEDYPGMVSVIDRIRDEKNLPANYIFYLATPPSFYSIIPKNLRKHGLTQEEDGRWSRVIIEKPFGLDLDSAKALNRELLEVLGERQIYRIDHYLGKETVQNILVTRFANGIYEPLWNRNYIHHVEITSAEDQGVGSRGGYYDQSGAMRDMLQNHLLQLVALVAMEPPSLINSETIRDEMMKVLESLRPLQYDKLEESLVRGQYTESHVRGEKISAYRDEQGVTGDSRTETYVALKLFIDNWRWGGVPFYIRTGKRLPAKVTEIVIHFNPSPHKLFWKGDESYQADNVLIIRIQPNEGILLKFGMKVQGAGYHVQNVNMDFHYKDLSNADIPEAYERLLLDCMQGDSTLYARGDAVEAAWRFVDPILRRWEEDPGFPLHGYPGGTWGPEQADALIEGDEYAWRYPCKNLADDGLYCEL